LSEVLRVSTTQVL